MKTRMTLYLIMIPVVLTALWFVSNTRASTETPEYKVIRTDGKVEIRDYPSLTVATTQMAGDGMNGGFRQLFRFITGSNEAKEKIEMTSPVLITNATGKKAMSFVMPAKTVAKGVPKPTGETVKLNRLDAARFAVLRFSGRRSAGNEEKAIATLKAWMQAQKLTGQEEPMFAYYDPPWTPTPMRRNEVMIRIEAQR